MPKVNTKSLRSLVKMRKPSVLTKAMTESADYIDELEKENKRLNAFYNYFAELYGKGLEVANWHLNGELEPFDNFFDSAEQEMELVRTFRKETV